MNDKTEMPQEAARPKRKFGPSTVARLQVARVSEMGAFLDAQTGNTSDDILLHKTQQTHPVAVGDLVDVFLYLDPKRRLTASMRVPKMKEGQIARPVSYTHLVTSYIESAAGIAAGGKTGLTAVTVSICFLIAMPAALSM